MIFRWVSIPAVVCVMLGGPDTKDVAAADWPMRGKDRTRNAVSLETNAPVSWRIPSEEGRLPKVEAKNIRWSARLGSVSWGDPVIADGLVWVGTNNGHPRDSKQTGDGAVLMCFRERDGKFLYQYVSPRKQEGKIYDWESASLASSPLVEGGRLWFCNNRCEVICLDIAPLHTNQGEPRSVWKVDMMKELGVVPRGVMIGNNAIQCSITSHGNLIYVNTTNARSYREVPAPEAPSLVCFEKSTGKVVWKDNSPDKNILDFQFGSPLVVEMDGGVQVIMGQGDGWLRSFDAMTGKPLWKFDINFKTPGPRTITFGAPRTGSSGNLNYFLAIPVCHDHRIYAAGGREPEKSGGPGRLCCIDPTRRGDISSELDDGAGNGQPNPNSGLVWEYTGHGGDEMHGTISSVAIHNSLVIAADFNGFVHCLDEATGKCHWKINLNSQILCSPLIADGKVYIGDEDGDVVILKLAQTKIKLAEFNLGESEMIESSPVYANGTLYIMTREHLYAIKETIH